MYLDGYVYPNANYGYEVIQRVPNVDAVSACRVPLDGRVSYFVLNDNSAICTKFIDRPLSLMSGSVHRLP